MNIAFGTLLILFLLSPGFALRYAFLRGPYSRKISKPAYSDEVFWAIIPSVIIQLIGLTILIHLGVEVAIKDIYYLLLASDKGKIDFDTLESNLFPFLAYQILLIFSSALLGFCIRRLSIKLSWDKKFSFLKVGNDWYYLFNGRILDNPEAIDLIQIDILSGDVIYCGTLDKFFLTSDGAIDRLYLRDVYRRSFSHDHKQDNAPKDEDERYYNMPGEYFVIFGKDIQNFNITYYILSESKDDEPEMES